MGARHAYQEIAKAEAQKLGQHQGAAAERARMRGELLKDVTILLVRLPGSSTEIEVVQMEDLRAALDRICLEGE